MRFTRLAVRFIPAALLLLAAAGCATEPSDNVRNSLQAGKAKWASLNLKNYEFTMTLACFCGAPAAPVRVTVVNGVVTSRIDTNTEAPVAASANQHYPNVEGLVDLVENALNQGVDNISTRWDQERGYPFNVLIDYRFATIEDNISWNVKDFAVTP